MLLENKNAVIYGAGGAVGGAVARAFAREGARVFLTGRNPGAIDTLAKEISAAGGTAETAEVDALDEQAVANHLDSVVDTAGTVDISFNAIGIPQHDMQGIPFTELSAESFSLPMTTYAMAHFVTGRAAARHMIAQRSGVVIMHTPQPDDLGGIPCFLGREISPETCDHSGGTRGSGRLRGLRSGSRDDRDRRQSDRRNHRRLIVGPVRWTCAGAPARERHSSSHWTIRHC